MSSCEKFRRGRSEQPLEWGIVTTPGSYPGMVWSASLALSVGVFGDGLIGGVEDDYGGDGVQGLGWELDVEALADCCDLKRFVGFVGQEVGFAFLIP
jgi:hypothetical protein